MFLIVYSISFYVKLFQNKRYFTQKSVFYCAPCLVALIHAFIYLPLRCYNRVLFLVVNSELQSHCYKTRSFSAGQGIARNLWNSKFHYRIQKSQSTLSILRQRHPIHLPQTYLFNLHFTVSIFSTQSHCLVFRHQNPAHFSLPLPTYYVPHSAHFSLPLPTYYVPHSPHRLDLITQTIFIDM
jgi:hypothetical protein